VAERADAPVAALVLSGTASCLAPSWPGDQGERRIEEVILWSDTRAWAEQAEVAETLRSLGLKRINDVVVKEDRPEFRGMVHTVRHLVTVEEVD